MVEFPPEFDIHPSKTAAFVALAAVELLLFIKKAREPYILFTRPVEVLVTVLESPIKKLAVPEPEWVTLT